MADIKESESLLGAHVLTTAAQTQELGFRLAQSLKGGEVILAHAPMGVGKTCLAQGVAKGLGVNRVVNSPTFNMIKVYKGQTLTFYHVDVYRLENARENRDIGLWDILNDPAGVVYIEWPEYIRDELKGLEKALWIDLKMRDDGTREATIEYVKL